MPRRQKPPGFEKWTWAEINAGRKMSKTEKRGRRLAKSFGATERPDGSLQHTPESAWACIGIVILLLVIAVLFEISQ